jgi:hypothetical protein
VRVLPSPSSMLLRVIAPDRQRRSHSLLSASPSVVNRCNRFFHLWRHQLHNPLQKADLQNRCPETREAQTLITPRCNEDSFGWSRLPPRCTADQSGLPRRVRTRHRRHAGDTARRAASPAHSGSFSTAGIRSVRRAAQAGLSPRTSNRTEA